MKTLLICFVVLITSIAASAQLEKEFKLPTRWEKDFTIMLGHHGSMSSGSTEIRFTYDSCKYLSNSRNGKPQKKMYLMKEADRVTILKRLTELKVDKIKSESSVHVVSDGWSESICFNFHCIEGGSSAEVSTGDKNIYLDAYRFLEDFAIKKSK